MIITGVKTALKGALVGLAFGFAIILMQNYFPFIPLPSDVYFINYLPMELNFIDFIICTLVIIFIVLASFFAAKKVLQEPKGIRMGEIVLRAKNVFKSYSNGEDSLHVLKDLSIEVKREIVTITGKSGSGKSTLLNILGSIDTPDDGEIQIDGLVYCI